MENNTGAHERERGQQRRGGKRLHEMEGHLKTHTHRHARVGTRELQAWKRGDEDAATSKESELRHKSHRCTSYATHTNTGNGRTRLPAHAKHTHRSAHTRRGTEESRSAASDCRRRVAEEGFDKGDVWMATRQRQAAMKSKMGGRGRGGKELGEGGGGSQKCKRRTHTHAHTKAEARKRKHEFASNPVEAVALQPRRRRQDNDNATHTQTRTRGHKEEADKEDREAADKSPHSATRTRTHTGQTKTMEREKRRGKKKRQGVQGRATHVAKTACGPDNPALREKAKTKKLHLVNNNNNKKKKHAAV